MILIKNGTLYDAVTPEAQRADILVGDDGKITAIGELPEVADPERKEACRTDFRRFCEIYDEPEKVVDRHASSTESTVAECAEERSSKGRLRSN